MIKSPLRYPGGKSRKAARIALFAPEFAEYREPFVGGGSVFFKLRDLYPGKKFWISDCYSDLMNFWEIAKRDMFELLAQIVAWKETFDDGRKLFEFLKRSKESFDAVETAASFFVLNRITFSGTTESGGYSNAAFRSRFTDSSIERLSKIDKALKNVWITNYDYEAVISDSGESVFLYCDPPYSKNTESALYGKHGSLHRSFDHERLAFALKNTRHQWLLSYDNSPVIRRLYSFANISELQMTYGMRNVSSNSKQTELELLISNYRLK